MGSIPNGFPVSLLAGSSQVLNEFDLLTLINRINDERGGLANLTEDGLRQELAEAEAGLQEDNDMSDDEEEAEEEQDRLTELMAAKKAMSDQLQYASAGAISFKAVI